MPEGYYAHSTENPSKNDWQPLKTHLINVADLASGFAAGFNGEKIAYTAGILHDLGKYSHEFQQRLEGKKIRADHSTAGAREAEQYCNSLQAQILHYIIAGHHTGLLKYGSSNSGLEHRLIYSKLFDYSAYKNELKIENISGEMPVLKIYDMKNPGFPFSFYIRMLYSCLVDSDFLDTESFMNPDNSLLRGDYDSFDELCLKFEKHMDVIRKGSESNSINDRRNEIYDQCCRMAESDPGLFTLTVPTGGGKTLPSMAFALKHLKKNNLKKSFM